MNLSGSGFTLKSDRKIGYYRECTNPDCRFRYPDTRLNVDVDYCPKCGEPALIQASIFSETKSPIFTERRSQPRITVLLDNLRSVYNVGSIFRTCEGLGINEIFLAGITPTPNHPRLQKTSLGAENSVAWKYECNTIDVINQLLQKNYQVIGLECSGVSIPIGEFKNVDQNRPICLVAGNEQLGIDPAAQDLCDDLLCIPMMGVKESLNVSIAFAIAAFYFTNTFGIINKVNR